MLFSPKSALVCALLCAVLSFAIAQHSSGSFGYVVSALSDYQTEDGGFRLTLDDKDTSTLEATSHALFLSTLYGLKNEINTNAATAFVSARRNADGGFAQQAGKASDIESLRQALISYQHLSGSIPSDITAGAVGFITSLFDDNAGLFRNRNGEPDLTATCMALESLNLLGELTNFGDAKLDRIRNFLKQHDKKNHFHFPSLPLALVSANYYAITMAQLLNMGFSSGRDEWASYIKSLQSDNGGVYEDESRVKVSLEATAHAAQSLRTLQFHEDYPFAKTNELMSYLRSAPRDLRSASHAHLALASITKLFADNLKTSLSYEVKGTSTPVVDEIEQGAVITPIVTVQSFNDIPHAGLDIELEVKFPADANGNAGKTSSHRLKWSDTTKQYGSDTFFDTAGYLGEVSFHYLVRFSVAQLGGSITFEVKDSKRIGYGITVEPSATHSGKSIAAGDAVSVNTKFDFSVSLRNKSEDVHRGDFEVIFTVLDSSNIELHTTSLPASSRQPTDTSPFTFSYVLSAGAVPSGVLSFVVSVKNRNGVHTRHTTTYPLALQMVAAHIQIDKDLAHLGDSVHVSMVAAAYDARAVFPLQAGQQAGIAKSRAFVMDVKSPGGVVLATIPGKAEATTSGESKYSFVYQISATLPHIGSNVISFRYLPKQGASIHLSNYDSQHQELYSESHDTALSITVEADLRIVNLVSRPTQREMNYGAQIVFKFQIKDVKSGKLVGSTHSGEGGNAVMLLQHKDKSYTHPLVSAKQPATRVKEGGEEYFYIQWALNANAVTGEGQVVISAQDADNKPLRLVEETTKNPLSVDISIGGVIEPTHRSFSSSHSSQNVAVYVLHFQLKCDDHFLTDAHLRAAVSYRSGSGSYTPLPSLSDLAVATHEGAYEVSWTLPHAQAHGGEYRVSLFREIDKLRAEEAVVQQQQRKEQREAAERRRAQGQDTTADDKKVKEDGDAEVYVLQPFLEMSLHHTGAGASVPIRMDLLALVGAVVSTVMVTRYRTAHVGKTIAKRK